MAHSEAHSEHPTRDEAVAAMRQIVAVAEEMHEAFGAMAEAAQRTNRRLVEFADDYRVAQGHSPGRFAIQQRAAIGGWIILRNHDCYSTLTSAASDMKTIQMAHQKDLRVVDKSLRRVVWPPEMKGEKL